VKFLARNNTRENHFNLYYTWRWFTVQVVIGRFIRERFLSKGVDWNVDIIPHLNFAHNEWLHFGLGLSWLEYAVNMGIPTKTYYEGFKVNTGVGEYEH
jgi:hypothetical protein